MKRVEQLSVGSSERRRRIDDVEFIVERRVDHVFDFDGVVRRPTVVSHRPVGKVEKLLSSVVDTLG